MTWIYIGIIAGSIMTGGYDTQEHCEGHRVMLEKQNVAGKCVEAPNGGLTSAPAWQGGNVHVYPIYPNQAN